MSNSKYIRPGDLIFSMWKTTEGEFGTRPLIGIVIGVDYERFDMKHYGCEERVDVFWPMTQTFSRECDCGLIPVKDN